MLREVVGLVFRDLDNRLHGTHRRSGSTRPHHAAAAVTAVVAVSTELRRSCCEYDRKRGRGREYAESAASRCVPLISKCLNFCQVSLMAVCWRPCRRSYYRFPSTMLNACGGCRVVAFSFSSSSSLSLSLGILIFVVSTRPPTSIPSFLYKLFGEGERRCFNCLISPAFLSSCSTLITMFS